VQGLSDALQGIAHILTGRLANGKEAANAGGAANAGPQMRRRQGNMGQDQAGTGAMFPEPHMAIECLFPQHANRLARQADEVGEAEKRWTYFLFFVGHYATRPLPRNPYMSIEREGKVLL
jgi:hypothetical protein